MYLNRVVGVWRIHDRNESATTDVWKLIDNLDIWRVIFAEAVEFKIHPIKAKIISARCVAAAAQFGLASISMGGNKALVKYLYLLFIKYKLGFILVLITPMYVARVVAAFSGYYRRKNSLRS
jgi:hypothetical protein